MKLVNLLLLTVCIQSACKEQAAIQPERAPAVIVEPDAPASIEDSDFDDLQETPSYCKNPNINTALTLNPEDFIVTPPLAKATMLEQAQCLSQPHAPSTCTLESLDFLADTNNPDIHRILNQSFVTDTELRSRLAHQLQALPTELLSLFGSITALVIHPDISLSLFSPSTGAIYLSPDFLIAPTNVFEPLLNPDQAINCTPHNPIAFIHRYSYHNQVAFNDMVLTQSYLPIKTLFQGSQLSLVKRQQLAFSAVIIHELAHANDFYPKAVLEGRNLYVTPNELISSNTGAISNELSALYPLYDQDGLMASLGKPFESTETPEQLMNHIQSAFLKSGANDAYSFSRPTEDLAMLFEAWAMKAFFDIDRDTAFTLIPQHSLIACQNEAISGFIRNRLFDDDVYPRAKWLASILLPNMPVLTKPETQPETNLWCLPD